MQSCSLHVEAHSKDPPLNLCDRLLSLRGKRKAGSLVGGTPEAPSGLGILSSAVAMAWGSCDWMPLSRAAAGFAGCSSVWVAKHIFEALLNPLMKKRSPITVSPLLISQSFLVPG